MSRGHCTADRSITKPGGDHDPGYALDGATSAKLSIEGTYVFTGGVGTTQIGFSEVDRLSPDDNVDVSCTLVFDGNSLQCPTGSGYFPPPTPTPLTITFGQAYQMSLVIQNSDSWYDGNGPEGNLQYGFVLPDGVGVTAVPEPATCLLFIPALACIGAVVRTKLRK